MIAERPDRNFHVVYVGGPANGLIEAGEQCGVFEKTGDGQVLGLKVRRMLPWYVTDQNRPRISWEEARRMHELAGIEPWGDPCYVLEETSDPDVYRYRFVGDYDPNGTDRA